MSRPDEQMQMVAHIGRSIHAYSESTRQPRELTLDAPAISRLEHRPWALRERRAQNDVHRSLQGNGPCLLAFSGRVFASVLESRRQRPAGE